MIMTQAEKARAYDEAIKRAKEINSEQKAQPFDVMLKVFPELKDSEDEQHRKWILKYLYDGLRRSDEQFKGQFRTAIAWLEKQENCEHIRKEWLEHIKQSWYKEGFIDGKYSNETPKEWAINDATTLNELLDFLENGTAKLQHDLTRYANWLKIHFSPIEKQGEQPIYKTPSREIILSIWDLGNEWKELTKGSISTEYGTQLDYIQKHWQESEYYLRAKQSEQKPFDYESANIQNKDFAPESTPRYSIGDVLCDKSCTTLNKESQPNFEIIDIRNGMYICDKCSFPISQQDEYELVAKRIEQKPADKVEPKFHEGDWIIHYGTENIYKVVAIIDNQYQLKYGDNYTVQNCTDVDRCARLWDIAKDAKYGDVLASELCDSIILFKGIKDNNIDFYCDYDFSEIDIPGDRFSVNNGQHYGNVEDSKDFHPATKEQRDTLFKAMVDAGYMWDSENKILLSLKAEPNSEQKPAEWSEEDERKYEGIRSCIYNCCALTNAEYLCNWLETHLSK